MMDLANHWLSLLIMFVAVCMLYWAVRRFAQYVRDCGKWNHGHCEKCEGGQHKIESVNGYTGLVKRCYCNKCGNRFDLHHYDPKNDIFW